MNRESFYKFLIDNGATIEKDVFDYGFSIFMTYLKYLIVLIPLSFLLHFQKQLIVFLILFIPLRRYIGGYHMKTMAACFIGSVILALSICIISLYMGKINLLFHALVFVICFIFTLKYGVIDHKNKKISEKEKKEYQKRAVMIETFYFILILFFNFTNYYYISNIIMLILFFFILSTCLSKSNTV